MGRLDGGRRTPAMPFTRKEGIERAGEVPVSSSPRYEARGSVFVVGDGVGEEITDGGWSSGGGNGGGAARVLGWPAAVP